MNLTVPLVLSFSLCQYMLEPGRKCYRLLPDNDDGFTDEVVAKMHELRLLFIYETRKQYDARIALVRHRAQGVLQKRTLEHYLRGKEFTHALCLHSPITKAEATHVFGCKIANRGS